MRIITVFKTHFDIGFTELAQDVVEGYSRVMLRDAILSCENSQQLGERLQFVWTMSAWPLMKSLRASSDEQRKRAERLIERGQLVCHALPFTVHTEFLSVRQAEHLFDAVREFCTTYQKPFPVSAKMTDVPGHTIGLVKPLYESGVRFLHLGCNPASTYPDVPLLFWWENKQEQRILVFYSRSYGSQLLPPKAWKYPVWLNLQQTHDNAGPQKPACIQQLIDKLSRAMPEAEMAVGTMDDFYYELIKNDLSDLPVVKKDLGDTWIHGVGSYPKEVSMLRRARFVENLRMSDADEKEYYENALLFGEHTWGLDVKTFLGESRSYDKERFLSERTEHRYIKMEKSWNEQRCRAIRCAEIATKYEIKPRAAVRTLENEHWKIAVKGEQLVILSKKTGVTIIPEYRYQIIGVEQMTTFMKRYLTRLYDWAVNDFGRQAYGEVAEAVYFNRLSDCNINADSIELAYIPDAEVSFEEFGNAVKSNLTAYIEQDEVHIRFELTGKQATPYIESGDLYFRTDISPETAQYRIQKINCILDPERDIQKDANVLLWAVDGYAAIDKIRLYPLDSALVSFGDCAIYRFNGGEFVRPSECNFVCNLYNNMWGTNFPQWIEGDFSFEFVIKI